MTSPTVDQPLYEMPAGDYRSWKIFVPGVDVTGGGYTGLWTLGIPTEPEEVELLESPAAPPAILLRKSTQAGTLQVLPATGGAYLWFELLEADTLNIDPRFYVGQGWLLNPAGQPVTVTRGLVNIKPSLLGLQGP